MSLVRKAILITGCDTGFGFSLAIHSAENLSSKNVVTIATCFKPDDDGCKVLKDHPSFCRNFVDADSGKRLFVLPLDVTDDESLKTAEIEVDKILKVKNLVMHKEPLPGANN